MCLLHHKVLCEKDFLFLPLQLGEIVFQYPRLFLKVLLKQCQCLSQQCIQPLLNIVRITLKSSHLFNQISHLIFNTLFLIFDLLIFGFKHTQCCLICTLHVFNLMTAVSIFSSFRAFNNTYGTECFTALKTVKLKDSIGMSLTLPILFVTSLDVLHQGLVIFKSEALMLV